ncbi:CDGSH iron-sulfur domain-containing protein [Paeniglutamicibacter kerguelensis]|uniref:CDGSH-type Zn-finger protein n=2 Tax=Paeniglutamicibacter kerguelensis TaxID=254788 RepID=A0ABS4XCM7_9MICC|nr:CDGSH-type Zn-finger protein [Paeniglutamicibacter kerguelensis]
MSASARARITICPQGPLVIRGTFDIVDGDGQPVDPHRGTVALCRCGGSKIKPFCDGTHKLVRFDEPEKQDTTEVAGTPPPNLPNQRSKEMAAMTESQNPTTDPAEETAKQHAKREDHVSDPSLSTEPGHDWTDEGGATESGPATNTEADE